MPWVRIDDTFMDNPVNRSLGPAGRDLFLAGLCYCAKGLTDGRIPKADLPLILAQAQAKRATVGKLTEAGRWTDEGDHYQVDAYLTYQPSKAKVQADREAATRRQARHRHAVTNAVTPPVSDAVTNAVTNGHPGPARPPTTSPPVSLSLPPRGTPPTPNQQTTVDLEHHPVPKLPDDVTTQGLAAVAQLRQRTPDPEDAA